MDRLELERDWLYNNSLTAFAGALLMLLAHDMSDQDIDKDVMSPWIQWIYPVMDWASNCLSFLHLPFSMTLIGIAFVLFAASIWRKPPSWAIRLSRWFSQFAPIIIPVGAFLGLISLVGDLSATKPLLGAITFYVGSIFLILITVKPWIDIYLSSREKSKDADQESSA